MPIFSDILGGSSSLYSFLNCPRDENGEMDFKTDVKERKKGSDEEEILITLPVKGGDQT